MISPWIPRPIPSRWHSHAADQRTPEPQHPHYTAHIQRSVWTTQQAAAGRVLAALPAASVSRGLQIDKQTELKQDNGAEGVAHEHDATTSAGRFAHSARANPHFGVLRPSFPVSTASIWSLKKVGLRLCTDGEPCVLHAARHVLVSLSSASRSSRLNADAEDRFF